MRKYTVKIPIISNKYNIIGSKGMTFDTVVCVTKAF